MLMSNVFSSTYTYLEDAFREHIRCPECGSKSLLVWGRFDNDVIQCENCGYEKTVSLHTVEDMVIKANNERVIACGNGEWASYVCERNIVDLLNNIIR